MRTLCIVPARSGSKRLPGKNEMPLAGKPLVRYTIEATKGLFTDVVFACDSQAMLREHGSDVSCYLLPSYLTGDTNKVIESVRRIYESSDNYDQIWLALPTCPLRTREDVKAAQGLLTTAVDGVISVTDFEFPPSLGLVVDRNGWLDGYHPDHPFAAGNSRSQDHPKVYRPNGALYGMWWNHFHVVDNFYQGRIVSYYMPRERSVDIDTELDFRVAEVTLTHGQ